jgi:hypothetical protein
VAVAIINLKEEIKHTTHSYIFLHFLLYIMSAVSKAGKGIMKVLPVTDQLAKIIGSSSSTRPAAVKAVSLVKDDRRLVM